MTTLLLFDLTGMVHRAFHGQPTNAARLTLEWAERMLDAHRAQAACAAVDRPFPTFRHALAPGVYKATGRAEGPERAAILEQLRIAEGLFEDVLGMRVLGAAGYEGDDIIATLAARGVRAGFEVLIAARDKDFCQLVGPRLRLLDFATGEVVDAAGVEAKHGVRPEQFADYLAIVGDKSDNVPGIFGCGPVAAREVLRAFGTLANALDYAEEGKESHPFWGANARVWSRLAGSREVAELARQLVTLCRDVPLSLLEGDLGGQLAVTPIGYVDEGPGRSGGVLAEGEA